MRQSFSRWSFGGVAWVVLAGAAWSLVVRAERGPSSPRGDLRVLAVGVDRYTDVPDLSYPVRDARAVARAFRATSRGLSRHVETRLLIDDRADRRGLLDGLEWLRRSARPGDVSLIFYAGHAGNDPPVGFYLAPGRYHDRIWRRTMISGAELGRRVDEIPGRVVVLLDTCYTGSLVDEIAAGAGDGRAGHVAAVVAATRTREETRGGNRFRHCDFTQALLEALDGQEGSDSDGDGSITLDELTGHLARRVAERRRDRQHVVANVPRSLRRLVLNRPE